MNQPLSDQEIARLEKHLRIEGDSDSLRALAELVELRKSAGELEALRAENQELQARVDRLRKLAQKHIPAFKVQGIEICEPGVSSEEHVRRLRD